MPTPPRILKRTVVARSRLFRIEQLDLRFSNGVERAYERLGSSGYGAVVIVPVTQAGEVLLVREYGAGSNRYHWGLPKGAVDPGEDVRVAANRELKEEAGHGARRLTLLKRIYVNPFYMERELDVVLAEDLYPESLPGDEPEPLATMYWPLAGLDELFARDDVNDAISMTALGLAKQHLATRDLPA
ncbi:MAG: ADP compounds hydrolase NudE [Pseudomonadota bacterium]